MPEYVADLLKRIREQPEAYIGRKSLDRLGTFLWGYVGCMWDHSGICEQPLPGFGEYIAEQYHVRSMHSWSAIISFYCTYEEDAFDTFYHFLDLFYPEWDA